MKRLVATALVALMLASCQEAPKGYVINGEVTGRTEGNRRYELSGSVLCRKYEYGCEDK